MRSESSLISDPTTRTRSLSGYQSRRSHTALLKPAASPTSINDTTDQPPTHLSANLASLRLRKPNRRRRNHPEPNLAPPKPNARKTRKAADRKALVKKRRNYGGLPPVEAHTYDYQRLNSLNHDPSSSLTRTLRSRRRPYGPNLPSDDLTALSSLALDDDQSTPYPLSSFSRLSHLSCRTDSTPPLSMRTAATAATAPISV